MLVRQSIVSVTILTMARDISANAPKAFKEIHSFFMVAKVIYIYIYIYLYAFGFSLFYAFTLFAYQLILQVSGRCLLVKIVIFVFFFWPSH